MFYEASKNINLEDLDITKELLEEVKKFLHIQNDDSYIGGPLMGLVLICSLEIENFKKLLELLPKSIWNSAIDLALESPLPSQYIPIYLAWKQ